jgi:AmmeMemoRadiSam system protein A
MTKSLTREEKSTLLKLARDVLQAKVQGQDPPPINLADYPAVLGEPGACFVTITKGGILRGCVGSIEAVQPLVQDVHDRAIAAGFFDYRFPPLTEEEFTQIKLEISLLTVPQKLTYDTPEDLIQQLRPQVDGVILKYKGHKGTFLPQVWEKLSQPELFLSRLCQKMGLSEKAWQELPLQVEIYQVIKFSEEV